MSNAKTSMPVVTDLAPIRREIRLAMAECEAACWSIEAILKLPGALVPNLKAQLNAAILRAQAHLESAKQ